MSNVWFQHFKDALYAAEQFFVEKKSGQYSQDVVSIQQFTAVVLNNSVEAQLGTQIKVILTTPALVALMSRGIMLKDGSRTVPGPFFKPGVYITIAHDGSSFSLGMRELLVAVSKHGKDNDNVLKGDLVNRYVVNMLAQSFCSYITQHGHSFMEKKDRDSIVGNTVVEQASAPYGQGQRTAALKAIFTDAMSNPEIRGIMDKQLGPAISRTIETAVENFDGMKVGGLQAGLTEAMNTRKAGPIWKSVMDIVKSTAGEMHGKDGIDAADQD